jgi:hypothetical protein
MRMPGGSYFVDPDAVRNQMLVRLTNKTNAPRRVTLLVDGAPSGLVTSGTDEPVVVAPMAEDLHTVIVRMPLQAYKGSFRWRIAARDEDGGYILDREVEFLGPDPQLLNEDYWREKTAR